MAMQIDNEVLKQENLIWFDRPAVHFSESTPLGNGRLGAMVYGGVEQDLIILNENSLWSGSREDSDREDAHKVLPEIRRLLLEGKNKQAQELYTDFFTCKGKGSGYGRAANLPFGCYQVLGNLRLYFFQYTSSGPGSEGICEYRRELDLSKAAMCTKFTHRGARYSRECFASAPAEAIVMRIRADRPGMISFNARLDRPECYQTNISGNDGLLMTGQLNNGVDGKGVKFACRVKVVNTGGSVFAEGTTLHVCEADEALIFITAATNTNTFAGRNCMDELAVSLEDMKKASSKPWDDLIEEHVADYRQYYDRVKIALGRFDDEKHSMPVVSRLQALKNGQADPGLDCLYFNFGRYLFISSSRVGGIPANLQGIWAEEIQTPWNGDWHLNAQQMIYWPAEVCNLPELHEPYLKLAEFLQKSGAKTAKAYYNARGWVAYTFTNPWGFTAPGEDASWGSTIGSPAWLCQHLWDHYLFSLDPEYLKWAYPIMKEAAVFYLDTLIEEPVHKWLVTAPSSSPENAFYTPEGGICQLCMGPAYDMQLLRYLFNACIIASHILDKDHELRRELKITLKRLAPTRIASNGRIMEWLEEYREALPCHRHISHLWGLFPGDEISPSRTPALSEAAKKTLEARDTSTGWAIVYRQCAWARLNEGNKAYECFQKLLTGSTFSNLFNRCHHTPETEQAYEIPPLDDYYHPFQIDANFGGTAGIAEMLLQSRVEFGEENEIGIENSLSEILILPALPDAWPEGSVSGLKARGGFEVDISWKDGRLKCVKVKSRSGIKCKVRYGLKSVELGLLPGECSILDGSLR